MKPTKDKIQVGTLLTASLYREAKAQAAIECRNIGELIDDAIRLYLDSRKHEAKP